MHPVTKTVPQPEDAELEAISKEFTRLHNRRMELLEAQAFREVVQREAAALLARMRASDPGSSRQQMANTPVT